MTLKKRIIIIGATSGIGYEIAQIYRKLGWRIGIAGRRADRLEQMRSEAPEQFETEPIDVTQPDAPERLIRLIKKVGGLIKNV